MENMYRAGRLFNKFLKVVLGSYMKLLFDYRIENTELKGLKPPYIVLANHTNFWDPFLLSMCIPDPVYFLTSDAYFRNPVLKYLLGLVGAIPKTKLVSDPSSIRAILGVVKNSGVIGIFPEGRRNWDGKTLSLLRPTAKLIKSLGIPVVSIIFKGGYLSMPRWATSTRRGKVVMTLSRVLDPEDINVLNSEEIYKKITDSLAYNEYDYQRLHLNPYKGRKMAERLELFLFCCPDCKDTGSMSSSGDIFSCNRCGYTVKYTTSGFFENVGIGQGLYFDNPRDWNLWQLEQLDSRIAGYYALDSNMPVITERKIMLRTGQKTGSLIKRSLSGNLSLFLDRLEYSNGPEVIASFPLSDLTGLNIQWNNQLEFISRNVIYRFSAQNGVMPAYKWVKAIEAVKRAYKAKEAIGANESNS